MSDLNSKKVGNYLQFSTQNFPLDCEGLQTLQDNIDLIAIIGNLVGDNEAKIYLLSGDLLNGGYVFMKTPKCPVGEVLYLPANPNRYNNFHIVEESVNIETASGSSWLNAYSNRSLSWGISTVSGAMTYNSDQVVDRNTIEGLQKQLSDLKKDLIRKDSAFVGEIKMWSGKVELIGVAGSIYENWRLCLGQDIDGDRVISESNYPELWKAIGNTHGGTNAKFNLPNLCQRFPVGYDPAAPFLMENGVVIDGYVVGAKGGANRVTLQDANVPSHTHELLCNYTNDMQGGGCDGLIYYGDNKPLIYAWTEKGSFNGNKIITYSGGNQSHENRPAYFAAAFIIKIK